MGSRSLRHVSLLALTTSLAGCGASESADGPGGSPPPPPPSPPSSSSDDASRAIVEADIIQLDGDRLYAMSESGTVSIVDVSVPGRLVLLGQATLPGEPFEMYRRGDYLVTLSNRAVDGAGTLLYDAPTNDAGALVLALDVRDPGQIRSGAMFGVPGEIGDSRLVGNVLYLATFENAACAGCGPAPRTMVTSFNVADPLRLREIDQAAFESNAPDGYNLPWGSNWKRSIFVTEERLYIGGHADIDPGQLGTTAEGIIDVLDVTDPFGRLGRGARIVVAGAILSRWQLDERDGVLRVVSQRGAGRTGNGIGALEVATFRIDGTDAFVPLGRTSLQLPMQEGLRTVRFDDDRAYAITYNQTDPLFVIDLSDPARPQQRGELYMPGFMYHLEPHGDRLIGLGIDRGDPGGSLNVSLFDVADPDRPTMIARVPFASVGINEDYLILNGELAEDQDRIQKAFRVFDDGLVVVPFSALLPQHATDNCDNVGGGVQLVEWTGDTLTRRALLPVPGNPRRALPHGGELLALSDSHLRAFSLDQLDVPAQTAELTIGTCVPRDATGNEGGGGWEDDGATGDGGWTDDGYDDDGYQHQHCAAGGGSSGAVTVLLIGLALALGPGGPPGRRTRRRARTGR